MRSWFETKTSKFQRHRLSTEHEKIDIINTHEKDDDVSSCFPATDFVMEIIGWSCAVLSVVTTKSAYRTHKILKTLT